MKITPCWNTSLKIMTENDFETVWLETFLSRILSKEGLPYGKNKLTIEEIKNLKLIDILYIIQEKPGSEKTECYRLDEINYYGMFYETIKGITLDFTN